MFFSFGAGQNISINIKWSHFISGGYNMEDFVEYLDQTDNDEHRARVEKVLSWIA